MDLCGGGGFAAGPSELLPTVSYPSLVKLILKRAFASPDSFEDLLLRYLTLRSLDLSRFWAGIPKLMLEGPLLPNLREYDGPDDMLYTICKGKHPLEYLPKEEGNMNWIKDIVPGVITERAGDRPARRTCETPSLTVDQYDGRRRSQPLQSI
ncbi:hypothetical protein OE88DRAFT_1737913 [Heliocybe sulcata]|uniref:Uncharacterized protein n=1 Tax=Heliocybe sulcata TaxID=5364 RepID=A0A5C3MWT5_9AGAM|nr:hypothetical protein OE88DRAFT_1737913 [Heliocybe sulcata]